MNNTTTIRMCDCSGGPCPARCNGWCLPCQDEDSLVDDLGPAKGIFRAALASACFFALVLWCFL